MKIIFIKIKEFLINNKKKLIKLISSAVLAVIVLAGTFVGISYNRANSNLNYSQDQLQEIALEKIPGEVVGIEKELNFKEGSYEYEFKIKDSENMLKVIEVDARYGTISKFNDRNGNKENRYNKEFKGNKEHNVQKGDRK